jgi:manganese oxidase
MERRAFLRLLGLGSVVGAATATSTIPTRASATGSSPFFCSPGADETVAAAAAADLMEHDGAEESVPIAPVGSAGDLDALTYPPPPKPARAGRVRDYTLTITPKRVEISKGSFLDAWTFNGTIPGPIIRATEGDTLRVTLRNRGDVPHSIHFHGTHPARMDGVATSVLPGDDFTYEFTAEPFGVYPYHCHVDPLDQHIGRGLFGAMIFDPPEPRPPAREIVLVMTGHDLNGDGENEIYTVNGIANYFMKYPIALKVGELVRIYLVNMTDIDAINSLHIHANMFQVFPSGTSLQPSVLTDIVSLGVAERAIVEFTYKFPGRYMFHAHQNEISSQGWMGAFEVSE